MVTQWPQVLTFFQSNKLILTRRFLKLSLYLHRKKNWSHPLAAIFFNLSKLFGHFWQCVAQWSFMPSHFQILLLVFLKMLRVCLAVCGCGISWSYSLTIFNKKTCLKFSYTLIGKTVLPPWRSGFFINFKNMNNLGWESAKDHLCQIIFKSDR